ncbi:MAG: hypothetical protein K2K74_00560, partial [Lachnospiraceae bacterium]|nr:hypothetical protein [Lachnospiraceae bacterium]
CFDNKQDLLELYNALNGTAYNNTADLKITTLDDCIYLTYKNDLSFILSATLNLYEHQLTFNPNMPVRGLIYFARLYEAYIKEHQLNIYGKALIELPAPRYIILTTDEICREYRASRSREAAYFLMRLCA